MFNTFKDSLSDLLGLQDTEFAFSWRIPSNTLLVNSSLLLALFSIPDVSSWWFSKTNKVYEWQFIRVEKFKHVFLYILKIITGWQIFFNVDIH